MKLSSSIGSILGLLTGVLILIFPVTIAVLFYLSVRGMELTFYQTLLGFIFCTVLGMIQMLIIDMLLKRFRR